MKIKLVYQVESESYEEEQAIIAKIPTAKWVVLNDKTIFFVPESHIEMIREMEKT